MVVRRRAGFKVGFFGFSGLWVFVSVCESFDFFGFYEDKNIFVGDSFSLYKYIREVLVVSVLLTLVFSFTSVGYLFRFCLDFRGRSSKVLVV